MGEYDICGTIGFYDENARCIINEKLLDMSSFLLVFFSICFDGIFFFFILLLFNSIT